MRTSSTPGPASAHRRCHAASGSSGPAISRIGTPAVGLRLGGGAQQRLADEPPARRHHHVLAGRRGRPGALTDDEAGVVDRHAQRLAGRERLLQAREAGVAVDEHGVEVRVGERDRAVVVALLVGARGSRGCRAGCTRSSAPSRARGLEQRHELAGELRAPEREQLDEHDRGPQRAERGEDALARAPPTPARPRARVVADEAARRGRRRAAAAARARRRRAARCPPAAAPPHSSTTRKRSASAAHSA